MEPLNGSNGRLEGCRESGWPQQNGGLPRDARNVENVAQRSGASADVRRQVLEEFIDAVHTYSF
jgi:hypothetical protein